MAPDGCGGALSCGDCPAGEFCGGDGPNRCGSVPCTPKTCAELPGACGVLSDGCAGTISCGDTCAAPATCGGGGVPGQCGCAPKGCSPDAECGLLDDGCGQVIDCGKCSAGSECGLSLPNLCAPCGGVGLPCCAGTACSQGYCHSGRCEPNPTSVEEYGDGNGCVDLAVAHPAPGYLVRVTVTGRPLAEAHRFCLHASCPGAVPFETSDSPYVLGADGTYTKAIPSDAPIADCNFDMLGEWECWFVVDGVESNHGGGVGFNSLCPSAATCAVAKSFCPSGG